MLLLPCNCCNRDFLTPQLKISYTKYFVFLHITICYQRQICSKTSRSNILNFYNKSKLVLRHHYVQFIMSNSLRISVQKNFWSEWFNHWNISKLCVVPHILVYLVVLCKAQPLQQFYAVLSDTYGSCCMIEWLYRIVGFKVEQLCTETKILRHNKSPYFTPSVRNMMR